MTVLGETVSISSCVASGRAPKGTEPRCHRPHSRLGGQWLCWSPGVGWGVSTCSKRSWASAVIVATGGTEPHVHTSQRPSSRVAVRSQSATNTRTHTLTPTTSHVLIHTHTHICTHSHSHSHSRRGDVENTDTGRHAGRSTVHRGDAGSPRPTPSAARVPWRMLETWVIYNLRRINVILKEKNVQSHVSTCSRALTSRCTRPMGVPGRGHPATRDQRRQSMTRVCLSYDNTHSIMNSSHPDF